MNLEIRNKAAEILYISGYAASCEFAGAYPVILHGKKVRRVDPFEDSLEGKLQACVIIEWIKIYKNDLWPQSRIEPKLPGQTSWQHLLKRLAWCLQILINQAARCTTTETRKPIAETMPAPLESEPA